MENWVDNKSFEEVESTDTMDNEIDSWDQAFKENFSNVIWFDSETGIYTIQAWDNMYNVYWTFFEDMWVSREQFQNAITEQDNWIDNINSISINQDIDMLWIFDKVIESDEELEEIRQEMMEAINESQAEQESLANNIIINRLSDTEWFNSSTWEYTIQAWDTLYWIYESNIKEFWISFWEFSWKVLEQDNWIYDINRINIWDKINFVDIISNKNESETWNNSDWKESENSNNSETIYTTPETDYDSSEYLEQRSESAQEILEENENLVSMILENFDNYNLNAMSESDVLSLVQMESKFNTEAISHSWSTWLFQITTNVIEDIKINWSRYDSDIVNNMLERNWFDNIDQLRSREARLNPENSMDLWMLYLKRLEDWWNRLSNNEINQIQENKENIYENVSKYVQWNWVDINRENFNQMIDEIMKDPQAQEKYMIMRNYNWDQNRLWNETMEHRYYYAFTVYYMWKYHF